MKQRVVNKSFYLLLICFGMIYGANLIFPITFDDDFYYALKGNPFILQAQEYMVWHGRYITHVIARIILQFRDPIANILTSFLGILFIYHFFNFVRPDFLKDKDKSTPSLFIVSAALITSLVVGSWTSYTETVFFCAYFLSFIFILKFISYFTDLIQQKECKVSYISIAIFGILAGNSHEQSIAILPFLGLIMIYLKYKKISIPIWFWIGILFFLVGFSFLFFSPGNEYRTSVYGNPSEWKFLENVYNWNELGLIKYVYSLMNIMLFGSYPWLIYGFPFFIFFSIILRKNLLIEPDWTKEIHIIPLLIFSFSWFLIIVMAASPLFHGGPLNFGLVFLYLSVILVLDSYIKLNPDSFSFIKKTSYIATIVLIGSWLLLLPTWLHYRKEYNAIVAQIEIAKSSNKEKIQVKPFTQYVIKTPFGNIIPVYLFTHVGFYTRMAQYYDIKEITLIQ